MEGTTFDLTAPVSLLTQTKIQTQKPPTIQNDQSQHIQQQKNQDSKQAQSQRFPQLQSKGAVSKAQQSQSQSSKSLQKQRKIEVFREVLDSAIVNKQQPLANKKEKKPIKIEEKKDDLDKIKNGYTEKVKEHIRDVYTKPQNQVTEALKQLEARPKIKKELQKTEETLNKKRQKNDKLLYEIKQMMIKSRKLDELLNDMNSQNNDNNQQTIEELRIEEDELEDRLKKMNYEIAILQNMLGKRRRLILEVQKKCQGSHDELIEKQNQYHQLLGPMDQRRKQIESLSKMVMKFREEQKSQSPFFGVTLKQRFDPMLEEILEDELSKCGDREALNEVTKKERQKKQLCEQRERECKTQQQQRAQQEMDKASQQIRQDKIQIDTLLQRKKEMFEKLRRVTNIAELDQIIPYKFDMDIDQLSLKQIKDKVERDIEEINKKNNEIMQDIKRMKYEEEFRQTGTQMALDKLERELIQSKDLLEDKEKQVKKVEKTIDEVSIALSRILYQLQARGTKFENVQIKRKDLVGQASSIQLRLERMLTVLSKTQDFLIEESINTNPGYVKVPDFIGLNSRKYADMEQYEALENNTKFEYDSQDEEVLEVDEVRQQIKALQEQDKAQVVVVQKKEKKQQK